MKKPVKWLLIFFALALVINIFSKDNTSKSPEELAQQAQAKEQSQKRAETMKAYVEHPVNKARKTFKNFEEISSERARHIDNATTNLHAAVNGKAKLDDDLMRRATTALDEMRRLYSEFNVPNDLPGRVTQLLTAARVSLKEASQKGSEAYMSILMSMEGKAPSNLKFVTQKMDQSGKLFKEGSAKLQEARNAVDAMEQPVMPK